MPTARSAMAAGVYNNQSSPAAAKARTSASLVAFSAVEAYDPTLNRWLVLPSMPRPRHGLAGGVIGNRLYVVSGDAQSAGRASSMRRSPPTRRCSSISSSSSGQIG